MVLWDAPYPTLYQQSDVTLVSEPLLDGTVNKQNRSQMTVNRCSLILTLSLSTFAANLPILTHTRSGEIEISRNVSTAPAKMVPTQRLYHRLLAGWERNRAMYFPPLHFRNTIPRTTTFSEAVFLFVNFDFEKALAYIVPSRRNAKQRSRLTTPSEGSLCAFLPYRYRSLLISKYPQ